MANDPTAATGGPESGGFRRISGCRGIIHCAGINSLFVTFPAKLFWRPK